MHTTRLFVVIEQTKKKKKLSFLYKLRGKRNKSRKQNKKKKESAERKVEREKGKRKTES